MRHLLALALVLASALPLYAGPTAHVSTEKDSVLKVSVDESTSFTLTVDARYRNYKPEYMGFKIAHRALPTPVETKGDPMLFIGGKFVGFWPGKHLEYRLGNGVKIVGHADAKNGNPGSFEIYHADGTMTLIRKADTLKPAVRKLTKYQAMVWRKFYERPAHVLHAHEMR